LPPEASRVSFLIDPDGVIQKVYEKVNPGDHAKQILRDWEQIHTGS
jgi:peroxiredoxin